MKEDRMNFNPDDLQNTLELPAVGGNKEPDGGVFDPWNLDKNGPPEEVLESIAKTLSGEDVPAETEDETPPQENNIPKEPQVEENPSEDTVPEQESQEQEESPAEVDGNTIVLPVTPAKEVEPADGDTMVLPAVSGSEQESEDLQDEEIIRTKSSGGRIWPPVLVSSLVMVIACCITLIIGIMPVIMEYGFARGMTQIIAPAISGGEPPECTNVLLVGVDADGYRTDTMMIATYDVESESISVMQLPRDTYVHNNGRVDKKLNSAYFSGIEQLQKEILMAYGIEMHKYVQINLEGFRKLIDAIGGVEMNVPINMIYDDPVQDFHIYLLKGEQVLDGKKAEQFVRFRKNNDGSGYPRGDLQRMEAQKEFIMATVKQMISVDGLKNINELIKIAQENVKTDMSFDEIYNYCTAVLSAQDGSIEFIEPPGEAVNLPGGSYFIVDYDKACEVAQNHFYATQETVAKMKRVTVKSPSGTNNSGSGGASTPSDYPETGTDRPVTGDDDSESGGESFEPDEDRGSSAISRPDEDSGTEDESPSDENRGGSGISRDPKPSDESSSDDGAMSR